MEADKIKTLNLTSTFPSAYCLLIIYEVRNNDSLSALLQFGWAAFQHVRLALVIKMGPGIALDMGTNTTKIPFLVVAVSNDGREQFLCPVIGESESRSETEMCQPSFLSFKNKILRFEIMGMIPYFVFDEKKNHDGSDIRMLMMFAKSLVFKPNIFLEKSWMSMLVSNLGFIYEATEYVSCYYKGHNQIINYQKISSEFFILSYGLSCMKHILNFFRRETVTTTCL